MTTNLDHQIAQEPLDREDRGLSKKQYLQQLGQSWYIRIKVPATLRGRLGSTHIRRALHTRDLDEANRRKWQAIAQVRAYFDSLQSGATTPLSFHVQSEPLAARGPIPLQPQPTAYLALRPTTGLDALAEEWAVTSAVKTVQFQRRQAYRELRDYLHRDYAPASFSGALAASYVDERLLRSPDSQSTRRRKLSALGAFWEWMASRYYIPRGMNPWKGFRLSDDESRRIKPKKRPYTMEELVTLFSGDPTYPALREVMVLGLYTGARIDEICSLARNSVRFERGIAYVQIVKSKTNSGARTLAISHPIPLEILKKRHGRQAMTTAQLFHELKGGGYDKKLSWHVGQAFRYHRNRRGLTGATDFHSLRRTLITLLENLGVDQVHIARYVGHSLPTLAFRLYSGGATEATQLATSRAIEYAGKVEEAVAAFIRPHTGNSKEPEIS